MQALTAEHITKTFPGQRALDDISLHLVPGEVHALLGENGSGKSTLIKILSGYHEPDPGGRILVDGHTLRPGQPVHSAALGLRFVHQDLAIVPELSAIENVALVKGFTRPHRIDWKEQARYTRELLAHLNFEMDIFAPLGDCKPVERSVLAIARAVADKGAVKVVVLDEPTASLPRAEVEQLFQSIRDLKASGIAVLYVSHRLDEVFEIADRLSVLRDGRMQPTKKVAGLTRHVVASMILGHEMAPTARPKEPSPARPNGNALLSVAGLTAGRLSDVSLEVAEGEVLGIAGIVGSGREDLARALIGALPASSGRVCVGGEAISPLNPHEALAYGLILAVGNTQPGGAVQELNVRENLTLLTLRRHARMRMLLRQRETREAKSWMTQLDVRPFDSERTYATLSGGNQQKVILGRCLNAAPKVLVLDEPSAGVDVGARQAIYELIARQAASGLAVIVCSSDQEDLVSVCGRALVLTEGRVTTELRGEELTDHELILRSAKRDEVLPLAGQSSRGLEMPR
jgi:ribose transport system ATP-binding protein